VKGYRRFIIAFVLLLALYIVAEMNRPKPVDWQMSLSKADKAPYGSYILYQQLKDIFPQAAIHSYRQPVYNQVNNTTDSNTAYLLIEPNLELSKDDMNELLNYVVAGNYVFISAADFGRTLMDTLKFKTNRRFDFEKKDSVTINFTNPALHEAKKYGFTRMTLDGYFSELDTAHTLILGNNQLKDANFIKIAYGDGAFFIHAAPLCFSNYFMLKRNNASYSAKALSYLPGNIKQIYWDEYYKLGPEGSDSPLRFILTNPWLKWALRIALLTIVLFVFFEMKRKQRVIPVIPPLRNSTLDFVQTVGNVYFNQRNNKNIALKKINYFLEFVRSNFFLSTSHLNDEFIRALSGKTGIAETETSRLVNSIHAINNSEQITDAGLLALNHQIDSFYAKAK
jgi:hypothetical protein